MNWNIKEIESACKKANISDFDLLNIIGFLPKKRSVTENKSLHKLFYHIADELNEMGHTFTYKGLKGMEIDCKYSGTIVKEMIWKPLQMSLVGKNSTTQLTNEDEKLIFSVLEKWFAEKGIDIVWPCESEDYHNYLKSKK